MITSEKLVGSENYLSWSASVELWFMGQGYEDHLVTRRQISLSLTSSSWSLLLLASVRILSLRDQILGSSSVPSLDDVFARLLRISSTQTLPSDSTSDSSVLVSQTTSRGGAVVPEVEANVLIAPIAINLATLAIVAISYMDGLLALPMWPSPLILRCLSLRALSASQASVASVAQPGPENGEDDCIGRESQGLYHLTSDSSPAVCIFTDALSSFTIVWATLVSPSSRRWSLVFPLCRRFRSHFELVHTDVWGPCRTASTLGFQYFVTFIDDYSPIDNAREYFSAPFTSFMSHHGILHQSSCAHTPQQNGVAERKNRHLIETARTILLHSNVPFRFWGGRFLPACYLINRMPSSVLHDQIPHSLLFPDQPLYFLPPRVFGCTCFVHILTPGQDKLSAKAMKCLFVGYSRLQKGYRCYSLETHRYFISADVTFFEDSPFFSTTSESLPVSEVLPIPIVSSPDAMPPRPFQVYHPRPRVVAPLPFAEAPADSLPIPSASPAPALPSPNDLPIAVRKGTRSTRNPSSYLQFFELFIDYLHPILLLFLLYPLVSLPKSTHEVLSHPGWRQAMVDEMAALHSNGTWDLVVLPSGKSTVGCHWVYVVKVGPDGQVDRLKARLVAKGYTQVYGSDYGDTFSPVAKIAFVRLLLSMAAMCFWPLYQVDIKNVFLHGDLAEEVYMEQPPGFCCSGGVWFSVQVTPFSIWLKTISLSMTKDLGKLKYFLGIEIAQSSSGVVLSQRKYALDILEETGMLDCKPVDTPMDPNVKLVPGQGEPLGDPGRYRRLVGKLNYLTITRPDISFPVSVVSQFLQSPCDSHWDAVIRILRYIKSTPGQGVLYKNRGHTQVVGYTDADWAGSPTDRRSTSGYCVFIGGNLISWKSKKQDVVARSSAEAEYLAMALATCELIWLRHLLRELRFGKDEQMKLILLSQRFPHLYGMAAHTNGTVEEMWDQNVGQGGWDLRFVRNFNDWELDMVVGLSRNCKGGLIELEGPFCRGKKEKDMEVYLVVHLLDSLEGKK
ncbi:Retrovirus-related Pol polyprotein from transposon TNT 1-94 [Vitis vinifera]|uniref:Retrovirus-related Pol polyprotein from transposon TNT 1-94 n=1 Tax=Vitis vinifera TaxID=29760 RepID=A0A438D6I8_VITVI|nr:Retrovirus-related Pol polyprotein from transposon TNT 1-94 [Vitis vinifera]